MRSVEKGLFGGLIGLLVLGCVYFYARTDSKPSPEAPPIQATVVVASSSVTSQLKPLVVEPFTSHIATFATAIREAEKQSDPVQRCLAYPDPPGSHWTHDAVVAYCHYRFQPTMTFGEIKDLIEHGKTVELDRRMDEILQAQLTQPDARGRLDHIFLNAFDGSFATRELIDAWKRNSPNSAYAYAASGYAYVDMAHDQRGADTIGNTAQEKIDAMDRLLREADSDLEHAISLNPKVTPAYVAMIHAGALSLGRDYARRAAERGLKADPYNWAIYEKMMWIMQPQWFGSLDDMQRVANMAVKRAEKNPLLWIEKQAVDRYQANASGCDCAPPPEADRFPAAFDELAYSGDLIEAGNKAAEQGKADVAVVYLSEAMRFQPAKEKLRRDRAQQLALVGESQMALDEINKMLAAAPDDASNYQARGYIYIYMNDTRRGAQDLEKALAMNPDDDATLGMLGNIYTNQTQEWDKAWDIADRLIRKYPESPGGWAMRATIQETQPRAGLEDTYHYFLAHFGNDPQMKWHIDHMHELLAKSSRGKTVSPGG